jgi:A/G-specific adenine glycosylase
MMDVGATICSPKRPACALCPWSRACAANARGDQETFPRKAPKREGKLRRGAAFVALRDDASVL